MNLKELYMQIAGKKEMDYDSLKVGKRVAITLSDESLDIMKIDRLGLGRERLGYPWEKLIVAKVCPGQSSIVLHPSGEVRLNELVDLEIDDPYGNITQKDLESTLGILGFYKKAHWVVLQNQRVYPITKSEMRMIEGSIPR